MNKAMGALSIRGHNTKRLLIVSGVVVLITVYCVYWATRSEANIGLSATVVKKLRPVEDRQVSCSFDRFRAVARRRPDGYIPGSGTWTRNGTRIQRFHPSICRLTHGMWIPEDELVTCLHRHRIRYIAIIGDSNGRGYLFNLRRLFSDAPPFKSQRRRIACGPIVRYVGLKYNSYRLSQVLVKHRCPCGGYCTLQFSKDMRFVHCDVRQVRCTIDNVTDVVFEYVTSRYTIDPKVQVGLWQRLLPRETKSSATAEKQRVSCPHGGGGARPSSPTPPPPSLATLMRMVESETRKKNVRQACRPLSAL